MTTLMLLVLSAQAVAQSTSDAATAATAATATQPDKVAVAEQAEQAEQASAQDLAKATEEEAQDAARFIPTEELSQDLGASFPVDI